jgi:hypothetical protein
VPRVWEPGWTDVQERGSVRLTRLAQRLASGAHFVVRRKRGLPWQVVTRRPVPLGRQGGGYRRGDQTVRWAGWPAGEGRVGSYPRPDYRWVWGITARVALRAARVARLDTGRGKLEPWGKGSKGLRKIKRPLGEKANALPLPLSAAFGTDLLGRVCKALGPFPARLCEVVTRCQGLSLGRRTHIAAGTLRQALERIRQHFSPLPVFSQMSLSL